MVSHAEDQRTTGHSRISHAMGSHCSATPITFVPESHVHVGLGLHRSRGGGRAIDPLEARKLKARVGWATGQIRTGRRATWHQKAPKCVSRAKGICESLGSAEPFSKRRGPMSISLRWT